MTDLGSLLGDPVDENLLKGGDEDEVEKDEDVQIGGKEGDNIKDTENKNADKEVQDDKSVSDYKAKYEEEKGYRSRLSSENKKYKKALEDIRVSIENEKRELEARKEVVPDPKEDPIGYLQHTIGTIREDIDNLKNYSGGVALKEQGNQEVQNIVSKLQRSAVEFSKTTPDFSDAVDFLVTVRTNELRMYGREENEIENIINQDVIQLAHNALSRDVSPAELLFNLAKIRGYVSKKEVGAGFDKNSKGIKRAKSLGNVSGISDSGVPTLKDLLNSSDEDFDRHWNKVMKNS